MAKVLTKSDTLPKLSRSGTTTKYPWDEWFDGQIRELSPGEDFQVTIDSMIRIIADNYYRSSIKMSTYQILDPNTGEPCGLLLGPRAELRKIRKMPQTKLAKSGRALGQKNKPGAKKPGPKKGTPRTKKAKPRA